MGRSMCWLNRVERAQDCPLKADCIEGGGKGELIHAMAGRIMAECGVCRSN